MLLTNLVRQETRNTFDSIYSGHCSLISLPGVLWRQRYAYSRTSISFDVTDRALPAILMTTSLLLHGHFGNSIVYRSAMILITFFFECTTGSDTLDIADPTFTMGSTWTLSLPASRITSTCDHTNPEISTITIISPRSYPSLRLLCDQLHPRIGTSIIPQTRKRVTLITELSTNARVHINLPICSPCSASIISTSSTPTQVQLGNFRRGEV